MDARFWTLLVTCNPTTTIAFYYKEHLYRTVSCENQNKFIPSTVFECIFYTIKTKLAVTPSLGSQFFIILFSMVTVATNYCSTVATLAISLVFSILLV